MRSVRAAYQAAFTKMHTPVLTRIIHQVVEQQPPPRRGRSRPKLRYAHQGGQNPPVVVIHGTALGEIPDSYRRYLEGQIRTAFELEGTDRKSTRLNSSHVAISYAVFCLKTKT